MSQTSTTLDQYRRQSAAPVETTAGCFTVGGFDLTQRVARALSLSTLVPTAYREIVTDKYGKPTGEKNPAAFPNCIIALGVAQRLDADPLMVMQNLYIVEGRPSWSAQFVIAAINSCGRFGPLHFDVKQEGDPEKFDWVEKKWEGPKDHRRQTETPRSAIVPQLSCVAWAIDKDTNSRVESPRITMKMACAEGWYGKNGSKWQTMPEVMLRYRAAAFFGRMYAPELLMGLRTAEEEAERVITVETVEEEAPAPTPAQEKREEDKARAEAAVKAKKSGRKKAEPKPEPEPETSPEVKPEAEPRHYNIVPDGLPEEAPQEAPAPEAKTAAEPVRVSGCCTVTKLDPSELNNEDD